MVRWTRVQEEPGKHRFESDREHSELHGSCVQAGPEERHLSARSVNGRQTRATQATQRLPPSKHTQAGHEAEHGAQTQCSHVRDLNHRTDNKHVQRPKSTANDPFKSSNNTFAQRVE